MKTTALRPHPFLGPLVALGLLTALLGCAPIASSSAPRPPLESLTEVSRLEHIRRAQVWNATDVGAMDLRAGPPGVHAFSPEQEVASDYVDESAGGAPRAHRDALKLLASLAEHIDSKGVQQRLICLSGDARQENPGPCDQPFLMVHDLGVTFGSGGLLSRHLNDAGAGRR